MEWLRADIEFASAFSYRMPDTSSQYGVPMLLPGPSTVKLALVATAILQSGSITEGKDVFDLMKQSKIKFLLPERLAVFRPLIKRLKAKKKPPGLESTFGTRGYVLYSGPIILFVGLHRVSEKDLQAVTTIMGSLRRLGTSDSLLTVSKICREAPTDSPVIVEPVESLRQNKNRGMIQLVKDISAHAEFEDINPYTKVKGKKPFVDQFYILPVKSVKEGGSWTVYQRL